MNSLIGLICSFVTTQPTRDFVVEITISTAILVLEFFVFKENSKLLDSTQAMFSNCNFARRN